MSQDVESGSKRAAEVSEAMLNVPGYADDSMFLVIRYGEKAKHTLRQCDWDELQSTLGQITDLWIKSGGGGHTPQPGSPDERYAKSAELRAHAFDIVKDFPDLARDFDRFMAACQATTAAMRRSGKK
ncbi:hypothetical protein TOPH_04635 [Tolypocladium ophioglossoides CBS 100239]|uniref:Uncharacterized protein n=1 Tax=Tolypocladium ophioglossoides (strain CBS 100239) TaxID=1163406 RepID=A0A0L0N9Y3_TOLOC|nr:hypothetical protein TOPH_04635 [Tolypocladium ophioglossoides CBS 100239]